MENPDPTGGAPEPRAKKITCEFCKCKLTQDGEILNMSEDARKMRDASDEHAKAIKALETEKKNLEGTVETLRAEIEDLKNRPAPGSGSARKGFLVRGAA